jgi:hypothetical protein
LDIESSFLTQVTRLPLHISLAITLSGELKAKGTYEQVKEKDFQITRSKL